MFFKKIFAGGRKEQSVAKEMANHIKLLCTACGLFKTALEKSVQGQLSPQEAMDGYAAEANKLLEEYNQLYK